MDGFWKAAGAVLIASVLGIAIGKKEKDIALLLSMAVCCMVGLQAVFYLEPVFSLFHELEILGKLQDGMIGILLKATGTALVSEIAAMTCTDAGNASLGKMVHLLGNGVILYLSIPVVQSFIALLQEILGQL